MIEYMTQSSWINSDLAKPKARLRLFCLPYAGGGASIYRAWNQAFPAQIEVFPIQLPGREQRIQEPALTEMPVLVESLAAAVQPLLDLPFALFGHSMGALIAFELAHHLRTRHSLEPAQLFVAAHPGPEATQPDEPLHELPDPEFIEQLRQSKGVPAAALEHAEFAQLVLPQLRADFTLCETYRYLARPPLACPITAYGGLGDLVITKDRLGNWKSQTQGAFSIRMFPGNHFFIGSADDLVRHALLLDLARFIVT